MRQGFYVFISHFPSVQDFYTKCVVVFKVFIPNGPCAVSSMQITGTVIICEAWKVNLNSVCS